jgi:hypothetical protein
MEPIRKYGVVDERDIPLLETGTAYKYSETHVAAAEVWHGEAVDQSICTRPHAFMSGASLPTADSQLFYSPLQLITPEKSSF